MSRIVITARFDDVPVDHEPPRVHFRITACQLLLFYDQRRAVREFVPPPSPLQVFVLLPEDPAVLCVPVVFQKRDSLLVVSECLHSCPPFPLSMASNSLSITFLSKRIVLSENFLVAPIRSQNARARCRPKPVSCITSFMFSILRSIVPISSPLVFDVLLDTHPQRDVFQSGLILFTQLGEYFRDCAALCLLVHWSPFCISPDLGLGCPL